MLACVAASDIIITAILCVLLWRRRTGFGRYAIFCIKLRNRNAEYMTCRNERLIRLLVLYSVEVGLLTRSGYSFLKGESRIDNVHLASYQRVV